MDLHFKSFRTRLLVFLLVPLLLVLAMVYMAVDSANTNNAMNAIRRDLAVGAASFNAAIKVRDENLAIASDTLTRDYAFRATFFTNDRATLLSEMENLLGRITSADFFAMTATDGKLIADTRRPQLQHDTTEWQALIGQARARDIKGEFAEADGVILVDDHPYHVTVLPFLTPDLSGWIALGFEVGSTFTRDFDDTLNGDVSVLFRNAAGNWQVSGSTLPPSLPALLATSFHTGSDDRSLLTLAGADYVTLTQPLNESGDVVAVLQRSLTEQMAPYRALQQRLFLIFALGMLVLVVALALLARNVTKPLQLLTQGARRIRSGDYGQTVDIPDRDEIGELAASFNAMASGLAEKERVRALLGKVVSPAIANELLGKHPELGGEERDVTVMFTDIHGFTTMAEGLPPQQVLALLNDYFTMLGGVIEQHHGVVDKYIGDAVMALFGAPLPDPDAVPHAVAAALAVKPALVRLNEALAARGLPPISMRIGIHHDRIVVGNMGSQERLNYTAIGDGVNLASRLENLCKPYGVDLIVSESVRITAPQFLYLPLDLVRVKGKQQPVRIYTVLPPAIPAEGVHEAIRCFGAFLQCWQAGDWTAAATALDAYAAAADGIEPLRNGLVALYRQRLQHFHTAPPRDWDGVYTFHDK